MLRRIQSTTQEKRQMINSKRYFFEKKNTKYLLFQKKYVLLQPLLINRERLVILIRF